MNKPIILNIETSSSICSVAMQYNDIVYEKKNIQGKSHAEVLTVQIQEIIAEAKIKIHNIDAIAVSEGPGSYTGLRIGVSVAKGLCFSLDIPLIAINPLLVMAVQAKKIIGNNQNNFYLIPMMDAKRMEVYTTTFNNDLHKIKSTEALVIDNTFLDRLNLSKQNFLFGDGSEKAKEICKSEKNIIFINEVFPTALSMIELSKKHFESKNFVDIAYFEPFYLKDFVAGKPNVKGLY